MYNWTYFNFMQLQFLQLFILLLVPHSLQNMNGFTIQCQILRLEKVLPRTAQPFASISRWLSFQIDLCPSEMINYKTKTKLLCRSFANFCLSFVCLFVFHTRETLEEGKITHTHILKSFLKIFFKKALTVVIKILRFIFISKCQQNSKIQNKLVSNTNAVLENEVFFTINFFSLFLGIGSWLY